MKVTDALNEIWQKPKRHAVITAPGGAGKSCLAKDLACDAGDTVPIYIDLSCANGEHYIFSEILREYAGASGAQDDLTARKTLLQLFGAAPGPLPAYRLILDGIDDADKGNNRGLHAEINELSKCPSLQIVLTVRNYDYLKAFYYFDGLKDFSLLTLRLLTPEKRDAILKERVSPSLQLAPAFLDILRRPMFLSAFLSLASEENSRFDSDMSSARELFAAVVSRDIDRIAAQDGLYDKADYAFHYLLPALANELNKVSFTAEECKTALYKAYLATAYKCGAFDGISTEVISRAKQGYSDAEFPEFRQFAAEEIFHKYVEAIFIPRGYVVKLGTTGFRFAHRNWLQYFQMEHLFNLMQRYDEDPSLSEIPALLGAQLGQKKKIETCSREELSRLILSAWESAADDSDLTAGKRERERRRKQVRIGLACAAALVLLLSLGFLVRKLLPPAEPPAPAEETAVPEETVPAEEEGLYYEFVLTPKDMTVADFVAATEIVRERVTILADGADCRFAVEDNALHFRLPAAALHEVDPFSIMKSYVSRPIELFLIDTTSGGWEKLQYDNVAISREDIESVQLRYGSIDGVDPAEYGYEGADYPYIELVLTSEFRDRYAETLQGWGSVTLAQDYFGFENFYYYATFPQPDGRTYLLLDNTFAENLVRTTVYNYSHEPLAHAFTFSYDAPVAWEDPDTALRAGRHQVKESELGEETLTLTFRSNTEDTASGDWLDTMLAMKGRFDAIGLPYAIGTSVEEDKYYITVRTEASRLGPYMPQFAFVLENRLFDNEGFLVHGLNDYCQVSEKSYLPLSARVTVEEGGGYALRLSLEKAEGMSFSEYADAVCTPDEPEMLLYIGGLPFLSATADDVTGDYEIAFRHLYGAGSAPIGEDSRWLLDLAAEMITNGWLPTPLYADRLTFDPPELRDRLYQHSVYAADKDAVSEAIRQAVPNATVSFGGTDTINVELHIYVDEDLTPTALEQVKAVLSSFDFENSRFNRIDFYLADEDADTAERARLFFFKAHVEGRVLYNGIFRNGRMDKYAERFVRALDEDPFFAQMKDYIGVN